MTKDEMQQLSIESVQAQRKALDLIRWAHLDEAGAFQFRDAVLLLHDAVSKLERVADAVLRQTGRYRVHQLQPKIQGRASAAKPAV